MGATNPFLPTYSDGTQIPVDGDGQLLALPGSTNPGNGITNGSAPVATGNNPGTSIPTGTPGTYVDPTSSDPNAAAASILAAEYQQWQSVYEPIELNAMQQVSTNNPQVLTNAIGTATQNAQATNTAMQGISQRQNAALGLTPTPEQANATSRELSIQGSLNTAGAQNNARTNQRALNEQILMGGAVNPNIVNPATNNIPNPLP